MTDLQKGEKWGWRASPLKVQAYNQNSEKWVKRSLEGILGNRVLLQHPPNGACILKVNDGRGDAES